MGSFDVSMVCPLPGSWINHVVCNPDPQLAEKPGAGERAGPLGQDSKKKILLGSDIRHEVGGLESNTKQIPLVFLSKS